MLRPILSTIIGLVVGASLVFSLSAQETGLEDPVMPEAAFQIFGFGDSIMAGYRLGINDSFTAQLESKLRTLGYDVTLSNAGVAGDTTMSGKERLSWSSPQGTDLVILELGANDMLRGVALQTIKQNLDFIIKHLTERHIAVVLVGIISAPQYGAKREEQFHQIFLELEKKYQLHYYPVFFDDIAKQRPLLLSDGKHLNKNGVSAIVEQFLPTMQKTLRGLGVKQDALPLVE